MRKKNWMIVPVAAALAVSLTACGARDTDTNGTNQGSGTQNGATASGTTASGSRTGTNGYTPGRTSTQRGTDRYRDFVQDGRYTAYSDGTVAPNNGWDLNRELDRMDDGLRDGMQNFWNDTKNAARDLGDGIRDAAGEY